MVVFAAMFHQTYGDVFGYRQLCHMFIHYHLGQNPENLLSTCHRKKLEEAIQLSHEVRSWAYTST